ncbi:MAG: hypothetical protein HQM14_16425 [SAR324 cluster bacterium]|nr:hypothetical protein [SAR324 cluster bacterium]
MEFNWNLNPVFLIQLLGFFGSLLILTSWINRILSRRSYFDHKFLPCFAWGWCVYFLVYILGSRWSASVEMVHLIFTGMAFGIPCLAGLWYWVRCSPAGPQRRSHNLPLEKGTLLLVGLFVGAMINVGPYLEFPSDPLYHLSATQSWETARWLNVVEDRPSHFVYFVNHWLLQSSNISWGERGGVAFLTAVLNGMLLWNFIRFTRSFSQNVWVGWGGGLASIGFFGTSIFSYYRYYALADSFVAYLVFLEALLLVCACFFKERFRHLFLLPPLLAFCWQNHPQEVLLLINAAGGAGILLLLFRYQKLSGYFRKPLVVIVGLGFLGFLLVFSLTKAPIVSQEEEFYLQKIMDGLLESSLYVIRFARLNNVMGIAAWIAMVGAAIVLFLSQSSKKLSILAALCLWPLVVLWNPLAINLLLRALPSSSVLYRLIFGSLYWVFLVVFLEFVFAHRPWLFRLFPWLTFLKGGNRYLLRHLKMPAVLVLFLGITLIPYAPVRGKIPHLFTKTEMELDGRELNQVIRFLRHEAPLRCVDPLLGNKYRPVRRFILSDPYINQYLLATGYFYTMTDRWRIIFPVEPEHRDFPNQFILRWFNDISKKLEGSSRIPVFPDVLREHSICYVLLYSGNSVPISRMGALSGHWAPDFVNSRHDYSQKLFFWISKYPQDFQLVFEDQSVQLFKVL